MNPEEQIACIPPAIEQRVRAHGPVLDMPFTRAIYEPLLAAQPRAGTRIIQDQSYGPNKRHRLDVYIPDPAAAVPAPVAIVFPGGGFVRGDKSERENAGLAFARAGVVTVIPNYRLGPTHRWPARANTNPAFSRSDLSPRTKPPPGNTIATGAGSAAAGSGL